jgi:hypothetical protein
MKNRLLFLMAMFMAQALHAQNDNLVSYFHHLVDSLDFPSGAWAAVAPQNNRHWLPTTQRATVQQ